MRRDSYVGMMTSVMLYGGLALFDGHPTPAPLVRKAVLAVEAFTLPPIPPDELPPVDPDEPRTHETEVVRPEIDDVPSRPEMDRITQPLQPPNPDAPLPDRDLVHIPPDIGSGSGRHERFFNLSDLDQPPVATVRSMPVYPFQLKRDGVEGAVVVEFIVNANGGVDRARAVSSTNEGFEAAAVQGVSKWKFRAGHKGGVPVSTRMQVPVIFSLNRAD